MSTRRGVPPIVDINVGITKQAGMPCSHITHVVAANYLWPVP